MIFAVLERRLIQLLIKWLQFFINNIEYTMKGCRLENVNSFKDLGVIFDNHLIFDKHISEKLIKHTLH